MQLSLHCNRQNVIECGKVCVLSDTRVLLQLVDWPGDSQATFEFQETGISCGSALPKLHTGRMPACVNYTAAAARVVHDPRTRTLPSLCGMNNQPTLLLQLPAPVVSFATIKLPVTAPATIDAFPSRTGLPLADKHTIRMHKLWHAINMQQPGGPLVAFPCSATQCQVICHKVRVTKNTGSYPDV